MKIRQNLSADGLLSIIHSVFRKVPEHRKNLQNIDISMDDALMSGFAVFSLKCPSLLNFQGKTLSPEEGENIKSLYSIKSIPSDTQMRDILDPVQPSSIAPAFKKIFAAAQRGKDLESLVWDVNNSYLAPIDATGFFSSTNIKCDHCLIKELKSKSVKDIEKEIKKQIKKESKEELKNKTKDESKKWLKVKVSERLAKKLKDEKITIEKVYQHQLLGLSLVHPDQKITLPFCPEPIINTDGSDKNDCEINASKRLLSKFRNTHPHLKITIAGDDLYSRAPFIRLLGEHKMNYVLVAKESSHNYLFEYIDSIKTIPSFERDFLPEVKTIKLEEKEGEKIIKTITHKFSFVNNVPLNDSNEDLKVNFLEYWEMEEYVDKDGTHHNNQRFHSSWVTDIEITKDNVYKIMRGGRSRWNIENCVFNTLKNQGYHLDHNFGHGQENLSTNFALLMMLAFLIDQVQELSCKLFQEARKKLKTKYNLWDNFKILLKYFKFDSWEMLLRKIVHSVQLPASLGMLDTS